MCVVYITLNCNSLNKRPNCFLYVCTNFYINALHLPYNLDLSLQSLRDCPVSGAQTRTEDGLRARTLHRGFGPWGPPDCPRRVSDASSGPAGPHLKECRSLSGNQGWWLESGHEVAGSPHLQPHRPHIPGRRECGRHSSVRRALDLGGRRGPPSAHCPLRVANRSRDSGPLTGREGKA